MQALVRDYSTRGQRVVDAFAGSGTTVEACEVEGRECVASEVDAAAYKRAVARMRRGVTPVLPMFELSAEQLDMPMSGGEK